MVEAAAPKHLDGSEIAKLATEIRREVWAATHKEWDTDKDYYDGKIKVTVPKWARGRKVIPATAHNQIRFAAAQLVSVEPGVGRRAVSEKEGAEQKARELASWGGILLKNFAVYGTSNPFMQDFKHLLLYGYTATYGPTADPKLWEIAANGDFQFTDAFKDLEEWEKLSKAIFPFNLEALHPKKILLDPSEGKAPSWGIVETKRSARWLTQNFGISPSRFPESRFSKVPTWTYWDENQASMFAGDQGDIKIYDYENPYGFIPFNQAFASFGLDNGDEDGDPVKDMAEGLLRPARSSLTSEARISTYMEEMVRNWAYQRKIVRAQSGIDWNTAFDDSPILVVADPQTDVASEQPPNVPQWPLQLWQERRRDVESGTLNPVLRGSRQPGTTTATEAEMQTNKAKLIYNPPFQQLNHIASLILGNCARLVNRFDVPVTMEGEIEGEGKVLSISPDDFEDDYTFSVSFEATDPMEKAAAQEAAMALRNNMAGPSGTAPGISYQDTMFLMGEKDPEGMAKRVGDETAVAQYKQTEQYLALVDASVQRQWAAKTGQPVAPAQ